MSATIDFLRGRRVTATGALHANDAGDQHDDVFMVVGKAPAEFGHGMVRVQDVVDGKFHEFPVDFVHVIADASEPDTASAAAIGALNNIIRNDREVT